jgi:hypothetical protein
MVTTKTKKAVSVPEFPKVVETFRKLGYFETRDWEQKEPSVWNGEVKIRRYRITIEEIPESVEVLADRLQTLWDLSDKYHHSEPLLNAAKRLGYALKGDRGSKVRK